MTLWICALFCCVSNSGNPVAMQERSIASRPAWFAVSACFGPGRRGIVVGEGRPAGGVLV